LKQKKNKERFHYTNTNIQHSDRPHIIYRSEEGEGFRNLLYALYDGEGDVCAHVI